jgi:hypothetical protein
MGDNLESAKNSDLPPKTGWAKIRGEDITPREHWESIKKTPPHLLLAACLGPLIGALLKPGSTVSHIVGGAMLITLVLVAVGFIKQRKKIKRAQLASNPPETA